MELSRVPAALWEFSHLSFTSDNRIVLKCNATGREFGSLQVDRHLIHYVESRELSGGYIGTYGRQGNITTDTWFTEAVTNRIDDMRVFRDL